ncbi:MAG: 5-(carboxyamino)imidazole ribonucleotide mutase [Chromatiales bacterium]|jgi:5-(carboxyamino)imidazole ribonucleotide mutase|nr:5-(carboxyamino)imidazole ribonucleotide mutase [Chromatiales bacterium]MDP6150728.1 5-(carboxyamino)imidazole ribonucleotide mutase [Gammaproteobacteria bacterium]MDP7093043.1 5-(carboxyamino)imidazole ribonucleotide mutase [Gammaproteobacteria bacterium]MDP7270857.1 5-(carboxyamino)imidazole ribonucleotide mutase [Gammaproteobacteria bacterium]HJP03881.1 5-(carboxyamino)imidazole ribonucleotide mutase [Gammaproteobacteria bacterium]
MDAQVGIIMGSKSDWEVMSQVSATLDKLGISSENRVISAHRAPKLLTEYCESARDRGIKVLVCGAGLAAALPGVAAAHTPLPVLGVPLEAGALKGQDALHAIVQMPPGIPVGTLAIGKPGAINAALLAAAILALSDDKVRAALDDFRAAQTQKIADMPPPDKS